MRRIKSISFAISVVMLTCICSAQQPNHKAVLDLDRYNRAPSDSALLPTGDSAPAIREARRSYGLPANGSPSLYMPASPDSWNGGTGNWSNAGNWSAGSPGPNNDVTIYSGGNDTVILDTSATINSLTLGGNNNGTTSELADGGVARTLTISNGFSVGQTGLLNLTGGSAVTVGADSFNAGMIQLYNGSSLSIIGNLTTSGTLSTGIFFGDGGGNTVTITGTLANSSGSYVYLNSAGDVANVGTLNNNGSLYIGSGATLNLTNQPGGITDVVAGFRIRHCRDPHRRPQQRLCYVEND